MFILSFVSRIICLNLFHVIEKAIAFNADVAVATFGIAATVLAHSLVAGVINDVVSGHCLQD